MRYRLYLFVLAVVLTDLGGAPGPAAARPIDWLAPLSLLAPPTAPHYTVTRLPLLVSNTGVRYLNASGQVIGGSPSGAVVWRNGTITALGTLGGKSTDPWLINNRGQIAGAAQNPHGGVRAFLWENGVMHNLGSIVEGESYPKDMNDAGQVAGRAWAGKGYHAFLWDKGVMQDLGALGQPYSEAFGMNAAGQVVGLYGSLPGYRGAFLWENGTMRDLGTLGEPTLGAVASAINNAGQVVGYSGTPSTRYHPVHACLWEKGSITDLGTLGGLESCAIGLNDAGQVIGTSATADDHTHGFLWEQGKLVDLGSLGGPNCFPRQINAAGQVVGGADTGQTDGAGHPVGHAFLWENGTMIDLNRLLPDNPAAPAPLFQSISDFGQIVVSRIGKGMAETYLLTPI